MDELNELAREIYLTMGYDVAEGFDFSKSTHPQELFCFTLAVKTKNYWLAKFKESQ